MMPELATSMVVNITLWVLIGFSVITWSLILLRAWLQWRASRHYARFGRNFRAAKNLVEAAASTDDHDGPLARVCRVGCEALRDGESTPPRVGNRQEILERRLHQQMQREQHAFETGLTVLASIGSTAPFVGLFGTVWGIMHALQDIGRTGSASLEVVAGPIGEALIATAIGIATAIPAVLAYNHGLRHLRLSMATLEEFATDFMQLAVQSGLRWKGAA